MENSWSHKEAKRCKDNPLALRVYSSQLLGREPDLVLHGGGNTSVKTTVRNFFGEEEMILYIKGSGWDLGTIEAAGFAPVKLDILKRMAQLKKLSDSAMVKGQRAAMIDPNAPTPSVEAILHAIIPYAFVDHTHADSVVTITNTLDGERRIREVYGDRVLIVPYVMPGFILARKIYEMTRDLDWSKYDGMILLNHGIFTFADTARKSYAQMIRLVSMAEDYLKRRGAVVKIKKQKSQVDLLTLAAIRWAVARHKGSALLASLKILDKAVSFSNLRNIDSIATRGPLTPDHVIRTKPTPVILKENPVEDIQRFVEKYKKYFKQYAHGQWTMLDPAPRWAVWPGHGLISFGANVQDVQIVSDITDHTIKAIQQAEILGGWKVLSEKDIFEMEYWELEQAKLKKGGKTPLFQGKVALVTGAASGIGKACVLSLHAKGAVVVALDINREVERIFTQKGIVPTVCDVTKKDQIRKAIEAMIQRFGGLDIVVSNAGIFLASENIAQIKTATWEKSLQVNLSSHQLLLQCAIPYLELGLDPTVIVIGSKNVPAPGPGVAAYSVAKAGLTQLARVAALELAPKGIRVNVVHPNQVFDTAIWTPEVLQKRAEHYGISVAEYKTNNLLKVEITSQDVAEMVCALAGPVFLKTTGAQIPIDGGNDRVV